MLWGMESRPKTFWQELQDPDQALLLAGFVLLWGAVAAAVVYVAVLALLAAPALLIGPALAFLALAAIVFAICR